MSFNASSRRTSDVPSRTTAKLKSLPRLRPTRAPARKGYRPPTTNAPTELHQPSLELTGTFARDSPIPLSCDSLMAFWLPTSSVRHRLAAQPLRGTTPTVRPNPRWQTAAPRATALPRPEEPAKPHDQTDLDAFRDSVSDYTRAPDDVTQELPPLLPSLACTKYTAAILADRLGSAEGGDETTCSRRAWGDHVDHGQDVRHATRA